MNACSFFNIVFFYLIVLQNILYIPLNIGISTLFPLTYFHKREIISAYLFIFLYFYLPNFSGTSHNAERQSETMLLPT